MGPDLLTTRCPSCNATLRPDAQWCSLCHHDLRPAPLPEPPQPRYGEPDPLTSPLVDLVLPHQPAPAVPVPEKAPEAGGEVATWPCTSCETRNPLELTVCGACGSRFLQGASQPLSLVVPGLGDLQQLSRGYRMAIAAGFVALLVVPVALLTFVLTGSPSPQRPSHTDTTVTTVSP